MSSVFLQKVLSQKKILVRDMKDVSVSHTVRLILLSRTKVLCFVRGEYCKSTCKMINFAVCASKSVWMLSLPGIKPCFLTGLSPRQVAVLTEL